MEEGSPQRQSVWDKNDGGAGSTWRQKGLQKERRKQARAALAQFLDLSSEKASCDSSEGVPAAAKPPTAELILCRNQGNSNPALIFLSSTI